MKYTYYKGIIAENIARIYLQLQFYKILKTRDRNHLGEIDIIAVRGKRIIFVEVKFRKKKESLFSSITPRQISRLKRSVVRYQPMIEKRKLIARFDVIYVSWFYVRHIKNAFH